MSGAACGLAAALAAAASVLVAAGVTPAAHAEPRVIELVLRDGQLPPAQRVIRVRQGDDVTLRWTSDRALVVHLHGYDLELRLAPGQPATMRFAARATGRFPVEAHEAGQGRVLGYLEVHPR